MANSTLALIVFFGILLIIANYHAIKYIIKQNKGTIIPNDSAEFGSVCLLLIEIMVIIIGIIFSLDKLPRLID